MTTAELTFKLAKKFPSPQYAFLTQVRNQTGYSSHVGAIRTADALALGLWKSRGYHLHGFEIKISRSDWQHELKDPSKAEAIAEYCDMFSLVVSDLSVFDISEVPKTWGIMVAKNGTVKTHREAPLLEPKPMDRSFLCGFMRNVTEQIDRNYIPTVDFDKKVDERVKAKIDNEIYKANSAAKNYHNLLEKIDQFEKASGLNLKQLEWGWTKPEKLGEAVKQVMDGSHLRFKEELIYLKTSAERTLERIKEEVDKL